MNVSLRRKVITFCFLSFLFTHTVFGLDLDGLSKSDIQMTRQIIAKMQPLIRERDVEETLPKLTFEELDQPLTKSERKFLKQFRHLSRKETGIKIPWRGLSTGEKDLIALKGQKVKDKIKVRAEGKTRTVIVNRTLPPQFLPLTVYQKYFEMMAAMEKDIGRRLYVDSGYRSSAFQLYLFVYYLKNHGYSVKETVKYVTLPGYSEHGDPEHQAIDFINKDGINGDPHVEAFEALDENGWLHANAYKFGFLLSYPKDSSTGITYEPWHWRYDPKAARRKEEEKRSKKDMR